MNDLADVIDKLTTIVAQAKMGDPRSLADHLEQLTGVMMEIQAQRPSDPLPAVVAQLVCLAQLWFDFDVHFDAEASFSAALTQGIGAKSAENEPGGS